MSIDLKPGYWFHGLAHVDVKPCGPMPNGGDILFALYRKDDEPEKWIFKYRFRYNARANGTPWDEDRKTWYEATLKGTYDEVVPKIHECVDGLTSIYPNAQPPDWVVTDGGYELTMEKMLRAEKPWMHVKAVDAETGEPKPVSIVRRSNAS